MVRGNVIDSVMEEADVRQKQRRRILEHPVVSKYLPSQPAHHTSSVPPLEVWA